MEGSINMSIETIELKIIIITIIVYILMTALFNMGKKLHNKGNQVSDRDKRDTGTSICLLAIFTALAFTGAILILLDIILRIISA